MDRRDDIYYSDEEDDVFDYVNRSIQKCIRECEEGIYTKIREYSEKQMKEHISKQLKNIKLFHHKEMFYGQQKSAFFFFTLNYLGLSFNFNDDILRPSLGFT